MKKEDKWRKDKKNEEKKKVMRTKNKSNERSTKRSTLLQLKVKTTPDTTKKCNYMAYKWYILYLQ